MIDSNNLILDLRKIRKYAKIKEDGNWQFRRFLKNQNPPKVDRIVHRLNRIISKQIDCLKCGNCCKHLNPSVTELDIENISNYLEITTDSFKEKYLDLNEDSELQLKVSPCIFLNGKKCKIYKLRPEVCRSFPHLHPEFDSKTLISETR